MRDVLSARAFGRPQAAAPKPVKRGDVLLTSKPFVYLVSSSLKSLYCDYCLAKKGRNGLQRCSGCRLEHYCGKECQAAAWGLHRLECRHLKRVAPRVPPDAARLMAKVILKLQHGGDKLAEEISTNYSRKFKDLMNHYSDIKKDSKRHEHFVSLVAVLESFLVGMELPNEAELQGIFGRICVNSFSITDPDQNTVGTGVYLAASIFDHSCEPNAYVAFDGFELTCRSLVDLPVLDWSKLRISYIDVLNPREERQADLQRRYYFLCDCVRCSSPEWEEEQVGPLCCGNTNCSGMVFIPEGLRRHQVSKKVPDCRENSAEVINEEINISSQSSGTEKIYDPETQGKREILTASCSHCGTSKPMTPDQVEMYYSVASFCKEQLDLCKDHYYLDLCEKGLERATGVLHDLNIFLVRLRDAAFEASISLSHWEKASTYGSLNIEGLSHYYGKKHPSLGMVLLKLGKILVYVGSFSKAVGYLARAESILKASHGTTHPLYTEQAAPLYMQAREEMREAEKMAGWKGKKGLSGTSGGGPVR